MGIWNKKASKKRSDPRVIVWAWGAIEADFAGYYGIDLVEEGFKDTLSWRRFFMLLKGLPEGSAYARWLKNKENRQFAEWSEDKVDEDINKVTDMSKKR